MSRRLIWQKWKRALRACCKLRQKYIDLLVKTRIEVLCAADGLADGESAVCVNARSRNHIERGYRIWGASMKHILQITFMKQ